ncbi:MAG TPA: hypothetical protein VGD77_01920 [Gemmatimonadaceae bacterium]
MTAVTQAKLALAVIGVVVWGWAVRVDDARLRLIGIGFMAAAVLLRFLKPGGPRRGRREEEGPSA